MKKLAKILMGLCVLIPSVALADGDDVLRSHGVNPDKLKSCFVSKSVPVCAAAAKYYANQPPGGKEHLCALLVADGLAIKFGAYLENNELGVGLGDSTLNIVANSDCPDDLSSLAQSVGNVGK